MARAVAITAPGGTERLAVVEREVPAPGPGELRIAVAAAAVNPTDLVLRERGVEGVEPPWVPGTELAGTVESVGPGVERLAPGDAVIAAVNARRPEGGAQAELVVVAEESAAPAPVGVAASAAATLPLNGLTALLGLDRVGLAPGATLAVSGGAGMLASYVIALARRAELRVVADAAPADAELVRSFGADVVVERGDGFAAAVRAATGGAGADALFDTAALGAGALDAVADGGGLVAVRGWDAGDPPRGIEVHPIVVAETFGRTDRLELLAALAADGTLRPRVAAEYPPEGAAEAHAAMAAGGLRGRAVIVF